ncbi:MAG: hypothetical protein VYB54_03465 [Pseudomonadota bacterium]|nr:hypothetical protein [Pseudomonadota bacterium]
MFERLIAPFRRPAPVADLDAVARFQRERAAFISQKCTVEYARARAGILWSRLFSEKAFMEALRAGQFVAFAAMLGDVSELLLGKLRTATAADPARLGALLSRMAGDSLAPCPPPAGRSGWDAELQAIIVQLDGAMVAPPRPAHAIPGRSVAIVYDSLPIHDNLKGHDRAVIDAHIRFQMARAAEDLERRIDGPALARALDRADRVGVV